MSAHAHSAQGHEGEHKHPTWQTYAKIALVLFILTFLEVYAFEIGRSETNPLHGAVGPIVVPILLVLSALKFFLVAAFYMHLKQDSKLFTHLFFWRIVIASIVIVSLIMLFNYWIKPMVF